MSTLTVPSPWPGTGLGLDDQELVVGSEEMSLGHLQLTLDHHYWSLSLSA